MTGSTVQDPGDLAGHDSQTLTTVEATIMVGAYLDPQRVTSAGLALCSGAETHCGLSVISAGRAPETIAATDDVPARVDGLQHTLRQGPRVDPDLAEILVIEDLAADNRWPDFGEMCVAVMNLRSLVSIQVALDPPDRVTLNFYSSEPDAFNDFDLEAASRLARLAARMVRIPIGEFRGQPSGGAQSDGSRVAVAIDAVIATYQVNAADAFDLLLEASHCLRRALLDVAIDVIANGHLPEEAMIRARRQLPSERRLGRHTPPSTSLLNDRLTRPVDRVLGASWLLGGVHEAP